MKHTGKILFGVLSTSALVGTGFAAWIVNNGFTDTKTVVVDSSVDTDVENKYSSVVDLTIVETDNSLKFASVANGEDLTLTYNLKANEAAYTTDFSLVTNEYVPDITVSLEVTSKAGSKADIKTEVEKYLVLPETQTITYDTWLVEDYKEAGHPLNINFKWKTDEEGTNPQDWIETSEYNTPELQREYFTNLANTLKDAKFTFTFKIGRTVEMTTFTVDENLVNGRLTFKDSSGNTLNPGTSYRAGTEVEVVPEADPYYKVDKVLVDEVEVIANEEGKYVFTLDKASTVSATFVNKVNTVTLNYEKTQGEVKLTNALGEDLVGTTLNAHETFKVVATPNENYVLKGVVVTQGEETLTDVEGVYTVLDNEDGVNVTVTFEIKTATVAYEEVTGISNVKLNNIAINEATTFDYGTEVTITFDVNEGYELTNVLLDGETLVATEEVYKFTVSKATYTLSFEVGVVEETYEDVATILAKADGEAVNFRGKVVADTTRGPLVLDENGRYVYVYGTDLTATYSVGDLVKVSGELDTFNNLREVINPTIEVFTDDSLVINDLEAVTLNYDDINADMSGFVKYKFDCRASIGEYTNLYIDGGEDKNVSLNNLSSKFIFEDGKYYSVEGYFAKAGSKYVSITASNVTELETVTVTAFTLNKDFTIKEGDRIALTASSVSPTYYKENPICEVDDNEYVHIEDGNILVADKAGTDLSINIRANLGGIEDNSFVLTEVGEAPVVPTTESIKYTFKTGNDGSVALTTSNIKENYSYDGTGNGELLNLSLFENPTKVFVGGSNGLKFSSGSDKGFCTFTTDISVVKVTASVYGYRSDKANVIIYDNNNSENAKTYTFDGTDSTNPVELVLEFPSGTNSIYIGVNSSAAKKNQRFYLASLTFEYIPA